MLKNDALSLENYNNTLLYEIRLFIENGDYEKIDFLLVRNFLGSFIKEGRLKFFGLKGNDFFEEGLKNKIIEYFDRIMIFFINCVIGFVFCFKIKSSFAVLQNCYKILSFCSPIVKSYFEKFSVFFLRNFLDFLKEIYEKKKIFEILRIFEHFQYIKNNDENKLIYYYNNIINNKVDYIKKNRENQDLIKKNQNCLKNNIINININHIPKNLLNGLQNTLNPFKKRNKVSLLNVKKEYLTDTKLFQFNKKLNKKKTHKNIFQKKKIRTAPITNITNKKINKKEETVTILGFTSNQMNKMNFQKKNNNISKNSKNPNQKIKRSQSSYKSSNCQIDNYFKNRIKEKMNIEFKKNLIQKNLQNLILTNIKSNKIMTSCKSTIKMKTNENIKDKMNFTFHTNQNQMKNKDRIIDIIIKNKKLEKKRKILEERKIDNINVLKKNDFGKKFSKSIFWKDVILRKIIKKDKDYSDSNLLKNSNLKKKKFNQEKVFFETKDNIKNHMENIEKKMIKERKFGKMNKRNFLDLQKPKKSISGFKKKFLFLSKSVKYLKKRQSCNVN